jgi:protein SCO1/2
MAGQASLTRVNARILIALVLVAVFGLGAVVIAARSGGDDVSAAGSEFEGAVMPEGVRAPDFTLRDEYGDPVSMRAFRGKPVIVTFLYTHCQDTCPAQAQLVRGALDDLGTDVPAIAIAVDPPNDTPRSARAFLSEQHALGRIHFVLGTRAQLRPLWRRFFIREQLPTQEHQERITLVDKHGFQRIGFPDQEATSETVAHDVRLLQQE